MSIVRLHPVDETGVDVEVWVYRVSCDTKGCEASIETTGVWTHGARYAARAARWTTRNGTGPGSAIYPRTDHCPTHSPI
jgi:hypothetical protein